MDRAPRSYGALARCALVATVAIALAPLAHAQVPGPNVNVIAGSTLPNGDPYLQRQNEPSGSVSTRNPLHILAGGNDYRTVDIPGIEDGEEAKGDAWLGLYKSTDGGSTWKTSLIPGFPQDQSPEGLTSPLKGYGAGADAIVRAGTNGLFYYGGMAFNRGNNGTGVVFVARFIDNNNAPGGDPFKYLGTSVVDKGTAGRFIDKPALVVDVPRAGAKTCSVLPPGDKKPQLVPAGDVYFAYVVFTGSATVPHANLMVARSSDCGVTWAKAVKVSEGTRTPQGVSLAIDPRNGNLHVAWREITGAPTTAKMHFAKSTNRGSSFSKPLEVASFMQFDQGAALASSGVTSFRTNAYPTMTIDHTGRTYIAWTRRPQADAPGRVVLTTSPDGVKWTTPLPIETARVVCTLRYPVCDPRDPQQGMIVPTNATPSSHQVMPHITATGGKITVIYYDFSEDKSGVIESFVVDRAGRTRHTVDVRVLQADPGAVPAFQPSVRVSQYLVGSRKGGQLEQLQYNVPNLPLYSGGDKAFIGDYIEVAGQPFIQDAAGKWVHNAAPGGPSMLYAFWTDNRDVRPPADRNWKNYTPVFITDLTTGQITQCVPGQTGMRNANIYSARITQGLLVGSPSNSKKLGTIQRSFVVFAQNNTGETRRYRMTILNQPPNGVASFLQQFPPPAQSLVLTILDVTLAPRSSASRTVYVTSSDPNAKVNVDVAEVELPPDGSTTPPPLKAGGLHGVIVLNPDVTNPDVTNPDVTNPDVTNEVFNPDVTNPDVTNPDVTNPDVTNPDVTNPDVTNVVVANPDVTNPDVTNPDVTNPDVTNPDVTNANIDGDVIRNGTLTDVTWSVKNSGNTDGSFAIKQFLAKNAPAGIKKQLIIHKVYKTLVPTYTSAGNIDDCNQKTQAQNVLVVNVADLDKAVQTPDVTNPDVTNPDVTNATLTLAPGEIAKITLRVVTEDDTATPTVRKTVTLSSGQTKIVEVPAAFDPAQDAAPIVQPQAVDTAAVAAGVTTPPVTIPLLISTTTLPNGVATKPYVSQLAATGGEPGPRTWSLVASPIVMPGQPPPPVRPLPPGLVLDPATGVIYGTPTTFGSYTFDVQVMDSASHKNSRELTLVIEAAPPAVVTHEDVPVAAPMTAFGNQSSIVTFSVVTPPSHATLVGALPMVTSAPAPNYNGSADGPDLYVYRASDGTFSATGTVLLDVRPINDAPAATPQTLSLNEGTATPITLAGSDIETANANMAFAIVTPPQHGTLSGVAPNVTYTPNARYNGLDSFTFTVTDRGDPDNCTSTGAPHCTGALTTAPATVALTVLPVNDPPTATPQSAETFEDRFTHIVPAGTDTETAAADLTFSIVTGPAHGTLSIDSHVVTYTPHTNYNGPDNFTFTVTDRGDPDGCSGPVCAPALTSAPASVTILVKPVNDAPAFISAATVEGTEDAGPQTVDWASQISAGAPDEAGQLLQFVATSNSNPALFLTPPTANAITGKLSWTAAPDAYGTAVIRFLLKDNGGTADGGSDTSIAHNVEINVLPVNDAPSFTKGPDQTVANTAGAQTIQVWATNITAGPLNESGQIVSLLVSASDPSLFSTQPAIDSSGTLTYTPSSATSGVATMTVTAKDNGGTANGGVDASAAQTFTITVNGSEAPDISPGDLVISEFRVYGPGGGTDQYVEIFNNTDDDIQVTSPSSSGFSLVEEGYGQLCYIPNGTVIPARGHYLCTQWYIYNAGATTSVDDYAGIGDRRQGINAWGLHDGHQAQVNHGFALFTSTNAAEWTLANRLDAVGSETSDLLYRSGTGLPIGPISSAEHAWVRRMDGFAVQNTGDNDADFLVVSTNTSYGGSIPAYLGAPGPETNTPGDTLSPRYGSVPGNPGLATSLLDPAVSAHAEPNQKRLNTDLWVRRRVTNNTGAPITRLRFRVTDIATLGSPGSHAVNEAEIALVDAPLAEAIATSTGTTVTVYGATLEQPPTQFLGGGINSSLTVALPSALAPGASIDIQFKYYVYSSGDYRVSFDVPFDPPVNQRPVANDTDYTTWEDTPVIVTLDVTDPDGDLLTYSLVQTPLHGALTASPTGNPLQIQYWPGANFSGIDSFTFKVNDKHVDSNVGTIKITIDPVNDAPTFTPGANQSATEAAGAQTVPNWATNISAGAADEAGQVLDFIISNDNNALFAVQPAVSPTGTLTYTPAPNANGTANVTVALHDDGGTANGGADTSLARLFQITLLEPFVVATTGLPTATLNQAYSTQLLAGGSEATPFTWTLEPGSNLPPGLNLSPSGLLSGTPTQTACNSAFTVRVTDSSSPARTATRQLTMFFSIRITTSTLNAITLENFSPSIGFACGSNSTRTWSLSGALPKGVTFNTSTGQFSSAVTPPNSFINNGPKENGTFPVSITVTDTSGSDTKPVTIAVHAVDQGPPAATAMTPPANTTTINSSTRIAQSVTVGATGHLTGVRFIRLTCDPAPNNVVTVTITGVRADGTPLESTVFATASASITGSGQIIRFPSAPFFAADAKFAVVLSSTGVCRVTDQAIVDNYAGGVPSIDTGSGWGSPAGIGEFQVNTLIQNPTQYVLNQNRGQGRSVLLDDGRVLIVGSNGAAEVVDLTAGTVTTVAMSAPRQEATITKLLDGRVLIAGGRTTATSTVLATAEIFDPATTAFAGTGSMAQAREQHAATRLECPSVDPCAWGGKVLITGGNSPSGNTTTAQASGEVFDPAAGTFTPAGLMATARSSHQSTRLSDGRVLISGGFSATSGASEVYDPATGIYATSATLLTRRAEHTATLLPNGTVLIAGGRLQAGARALAATGEIYTPAANPASATFTDAGTLITPRARHVATPLADGTVLLTGGIRNWEFVGQPHATAERFVPGAGFVGAPSMQVVRYDHGAVQLADGSVFVSGGFNSFNGSRQTGQTFELMNAASGATGTPALATPNLPDGFVGAPYTSNALLVVGGIGPYTLSIDAAKLPPGLSFNGLHIQGTPASGSEGTYAFDVHISDSNVPPFVGVQSLQIRINALDITTTSLPTAYVGRAYNAVVEATGVDPKTWSISSGNLPVGSPGFAIDPATGLITGTATQTGFYEFVVRVRDAVGQVAFRTLFISVNQPLTITTATLPDGVIGNSYGNCMSRNAGIGPYTWELSGNYPSPLAFRPDTSGCFDNNFTRQLTEVGTFTFTVTVKDSSSPQQSDSKTFTIKVHALDQQVPGEMTGAVDLPAGTTRLAQVFEAGTSFGLSGVQLFNFSACTPNMTIGAAAYAVTGAPARPADLAAPLAVVSTTVSSSGFFNGNLRFPTAVPLPLGSRFAVVITFTDGVCKGWNWPVNDLYSQGDGYIDVGGGWQLTSAEIGRADVVFSTLTFPTGLAYLSTWHSAQQSAMMSDGRVLLMAGDGKADIYDPHSNTTVRTGDMAVPRYAATATPLPDGRVVVIGGSYYDNALNRTVSIDAVEIFDPTASGGVGAFTPAGTLSIGRADHTATLLATGDILVAGGYDYPNGVLDHLQSAELYNPSSQSASNPFNMIASRAQHTATLIGVDKVLLAGGYGDGPFPAPHSEIYDTVSGTFGTPAVDMASFHAEHAATVLPDGRVLITGGTGLYPQLALTNEIFDPSSLAFSTTTGLGTPRRRHTATRLPDGRVLVAGGTDAWSNGRPISSLEIVAPGFGSTPTAITHAGDLATARAEHVAGAIAEGPNEGKVWFAGGWSGSSLSGRSVETVLIDADALIITTASLPDGSANTLYSDVIIEATGGSGTGYVFAPAWGELPDGLVFSNGVISGTPTESGQWPITVKVTDDAMNVAYKTFKLAINRLTITSPDQLTNAAPYSAYSYQLEADGVAPFTWSLANNPTLPGSVTLSSSGLLSGITGGPGFFGFTVRVRDATGQVLLRWMWINVEQELLITSTSEVLNVAVAPWSYGYCLSASGGAGPLTWEKVSGELPDGLTLDANGCVNGNTLRTGTFTFTAKVKTEAQEAPPVTLTLHAGTTEQAAWTIDSNALWRFGQGAPNDEKGPIAQLFTPAMDGYLLAMQMPVYCENADLTLEIRTVVGGVPSATVLASGVVSADRLGPFFSPYHRQLRLAGPLFLPHGTQVAAVLDSPGACWVYSQPANTPAIDYSYFYGDAYRETFGTWQALALGEPNRPDLPFHAVMDEGGGLAFMTQGRNQIATGALYLEHGSRAGLVMLAGGATNTIEFYNPTGDELAGVPPRQFMPGPAMNVMRSNHTATELSDGHVLVVGGQDLNGNALASAELYHPHSNSWTALPSMTTPRFVHTATLVDDDKVVIVGGRAVDWWSPPLATTEIFSFDGGSDSGSFVPCAELAEGRAEHRALRLADGTVFISGGWGVSNTHAAEIFDPVSGTVTTATGVTVARVQHTLTLLPEGVLIAGGRDSGGSTGLTSIERWNELSGYADIGQLNGSRINHQAARLASGKVLVAGGMDHTGTALSTTEVIDPATGESTAGSNMTVARSGLAAVYVPDRDVVVLANGWGPSASTWPSADIFDPSRHLLPLAYTAVVYSASLGQGATFTLLSGTVPPGLTLNTNGSSASLSGVPLSEGIYDLVFEVVDETGAKSLRRWTVEVNVSQ